MDEQLNCECWCHQHSFWDLCDVGSCIPNAFVFTPTTCPTCVDKCTKPLVYRTIESVRELLDIGDEKVKVSDLDWTSWYLDEKTDVESCLTKRIDTTDANNHKVVFGLDKDCLDLKLTDLVDGPWHYADCNKVLWTWEDCNCPLSTCQAWILTSKCDGSWWDWTCPNQDCDNSTPELNYDWYDKDTQFFWFLPDEWPKFFCPKKKFIAKVIWRNNILSPRFDDNKIWYRAPDIEAATYITNMSEQIEQLDLTGHDIDTTVDMILHSAIVFTVWAVVIPHDNFYDIKMSGSCITNRWIHTVRHQVLLKPADSSNITVLLDDRFEWTQFRKQALTDDNFIWVDHITDLNTFFDNFPTPTDNPWQDPREKMDWWLWRTLRWHWFWQSTEEYLHKWDKIFFVYKIQTYSTWEEQWIDYWQLSYVWDQPSATNGKWVWIQFSVKERDEYWPYIETDPQEYKVLASTIPPVVLPWR